ncbi:MAG: cupin domain-containing protein [Erythrobacter sp.]|nr:cupin domain-containing protein [Erythrobacter sp.]
MTSLSPDLFSRILSAPSAELVISSHLEQRVAKIEDGTFLGLGFDLSRFMELLRDRLWRSDSEIEFFLNDRQGRSADVWSQAISKNGALTLDSILRLKAQKTSIYVHNLHLMVQECRNLARDIGRTGYFTSRIYAMYSPANAQSTPTHLDPCDVIALQLQGTKDWTIDNAPKVENFSAGRSIVSPEDSEFIDPSDHSIRAGEALFIPRGFLHNAKSSSEDSLHIVIALTPLTWLDVMQSILVGWSRENPELLGNVLASDRKGQVVSGFPAVAELLSQPADPEFAERIVAQAMAERAQQQMVRDFGQVFARDIDQLT